MTDGNLTDDSVVDGHLTDEQLSSHLDGLAAGSVGDGPSAGQASIGAHLEGCARCRRRLIVLESVRLRLRGSVEPVPPQARADSIDAVLRAVRHGDVGGTNGAGPRDAPVPLARRRPQVLVGAAAAVLVLAGAVGIPLALSHKGSSEASEASRAPSAATPPTAAGSGAVGDGVPVFSGLGTFSSGEALRSKVAGLLPVASSATPTPTSVPTSASATTGSSAGAAAGTTHTGSTSTAGSGNAVNGPLEFSAAGSTTRAQIDRCLSAAVRAGGAQRTLQAVATATFRGAPALVYVFGPESPASEAAASVASERSQLVATARHGCKVLITAAV